MIKRLSPVIGLLLVVAILGAGYFFLYLGRLEVKVEPAANVQLNGGRTKANTTTAVFRTMPGKKTVTISKDGYVKEDRPVQVHSRKTTTINASPSAVPKISKINDDKASWLTTTTDGKGLLYLAPKGKGQAFYRVSLENGTKEQISTERLAGITEVRWSPNKTQAILTVKNDAALKATGSVLYRSDVPNGTTTNWIYDFRRYNFVSQEPSQLELSYVNTKVGDLAWSPDGSEIAYVFSTGSGKRTLNIAKPDFSDFRTVTDIPNAGARLSWSPNGKTIALFYARDSLLASEKGAGQPEDTNLYLVDLFSRNLQKATNDGGVVGALWSPDSSQVLYEQGQEHDLRLYEPATKQTSGLGTKSLVTKSAWLPQGTYLFVSAPKDPNTLNKSSTPAVSLEEDQLLRLLPEEVRVELASFSETTGNPADNLTFTPDGKTLFFTSPQGVGKVELK